MKAPINPAIEPIVREFKVALQDLYGDRLRDVILYGSYARGDYDDESDIDLMVVLGDEEVDTFREIRRMSELETLFLLKYGIVISLLPSTTRRLQQSIMPIYDNVRREGLWL
ncbi:MAG: nucleotidyltransferase domain-containing protein [Cytophagales bacterium]|nr:MAG: nucleotidyltransferase domain-containing protein [Cytophagales bacterium]